MGYRIIAREEDGSPLHSSDFIDKDRAISWAGDLALVGLEVLRIEGSDGEVIPAETISAALSARTPASSVGAAA